MANEILKRLYETDNFIEFCKEYTNSSKLFTSRLSSDFFSEKEPGIAVKYVEFILYKQNHNYHLECLEYLIDNNFTDKLIKFFKHLESIQYPSLCPEICSGEGLINKIISNDDFRLLEYFIDKPYNLLTVFSNHSEIFTKLLEVGSKKGIAIFKEKIPEINLFFIDFIINKMWVKKDNYYCNEYYDMLDLQDKDLLKSIINNYIIGKQITSKEIDNLDDYGGIGGKARELKAMIDRKKVNNLHDNVAKILLAKYVMESSLLEKTTKEKTIKI